MASNLELKISIEKTIHETFLNTIQKIWDDHNICIKKININWDEWSTNFGAEMNVKEINFETIFKK